MRQLTINHSNGNSTIYNLVDSNRDLPIAYHAETSTEVVKALEYARIRNKRVRIYLGDPVTGKCWNEEHDIFGYVHLSRGHEALFPILVHNKSSYGGGSLLDHCIIKIRESKGNMVLYQSSNFQQPNIEIKPSTETGYSYSVYIDGSLYSNHKTERQAKLLSNKLK